MYELEPRRVQKMPLRGKTHDAPSSSAAVDIVPHDRVPDRRKMNTNLMGPSRVQMRTQQVSRSEAG